jgi:chitinase
MPASNIDFSVVTQVIHFAVLPNADGSLDTNANVITPNGTLDLVTRAHAAKRQALICVGGGGTTFLGAVSNTCLPVFISHLTNFMAIGGYDGIDVDWEPLNSSDAGLFTNFVVHLRTALDDFSPHKWLTIALPAGAPPGVLASVQSQFDQINLMTYDLSGPWSGWVTWFNAPIYNGGLKFDCMPCEYAPSIEGVVSTFLAAGLPTEKLGIGIPFYGEMWQGGGGARTGGVTQPRQSWTTAPTMRPVAYNDLMASNFPSSAYHYDTAAQAAYLSVTNAAAAKDLFISFDDARACAATAAYARNRDLGGVILWELSQDHQTNGPDPLIQSIKQAWLNSPGNGFTNLR